MLGTSEELKMEVTEFEESEEEPDEEPEEEDEDDDDVDASTI